MKTLKQELETTFWEALKPLGFTKKTGRSFIRAFPLGFQAIHLAYIDHAGDSDLTLDLGVRFDALEDRVNAENALISQKEKARTCTLGIELGNLQGTGQKRWTLTTHAPIQILVQDLLTAIQPQALPYFTKYSTFEAAYTLLTSPQAPRHCPIQAYRSQYLQALQELLQAPNQAPIPSNFHHYY